MRRTLQYPPYESNYDGFTSEPEDMYHIDAAVHELRAKLARMTEDYKFNLKLIDERDQELDAMEAHLRTIEKQCTEKDATIRSLGAELATADLHLKNEQSKNRQATTLVQGTRDELRTQVKAERLQKEEAVKSLKLEIEDLKASADEALKRRELYFKSEEERWTRLLQQAAEEKALLIAELEKARTEAKEVRSGFSRVEEALKDAVGRSEVDKLLDQAEDGWKRKLHAKDIELADIIGQLDASHQLTADLKAQLEGTLQRGQEEKDRLKQEIERCKASLDEEIRFERERLQVKYDGQHLALKTQIADLQEQVAQNQGITEQFKRTISTLREQLLEQERKTAKELNDLACKHMQELRDQDTAMRDLKENYWLWQSDLSASKESSLHWQTKCEELTKENSSLKVNATQTKATTLETEVRELRTVVKADLEHKLSRSKEEAETMQHKLRLAVTVTPTQQYEQQTSRNERLQDQLDQLRKELQNAAGLRSELIELDDLRDEVQDLRQANAELEDIASQLERQLSDQMQTEADAQRLTQEVEHWKTEALKLQSSHTSLKKELARLTKERDQLVEISSNLRAEIQSCHESYVDERMYESQGDSFDVRFSSSQVKHKLPRYDSFEKVSITPPEREDGLIELKQRIYQVKAAIEEKQQGSRRYL